MSNKISQKQFNSNKPAGIMKTINTESSNRKKETGKLDQSNFLTDSPAQLKNAFEKFSFENMNQTRGSSQKKSVNRVSIKLKDQNSNAKSSVILETPQSEDKEEEQ